MSVNYNATTIADVKILSLHGRKGLGIRQLWLSVEFHIQDHLEYEVTARAFWARIYAGGEGEEPMLVGRAYPENSWRFSTKLDKGTRGILFHIELHDHQIDALEKVRKGGVINLRMNLHGEAFGKHGLWTINETVDRRINLSEWASVITDLGYSHTFVIGIELPGIPEVEELRAATELLHRAKRDLLFAHYDRVVIDCRTAIESVMKILGDWDRLDELRRKFADRSRLEMTKAEREILVAEAGRHYAHLSHHTDKEGQPEYYSREDAHFMLAIAVATVSGAIYRYQSAK